LGLFPYIFNLILTHTTSNYRKSQSDNRLDCPLYFL